ncbi:MAG: sigma-70 family RNA polymerase sigma factor [Candidatus Dormibacteraeota bacterium]|nr:sigma-70 family RNA polymerase sigma factor [Candidatus Dormibacteraeota bacterium]
MSEQNHKAVPPGHRGYTPGLANEGPQTSIRGELATTDRPAAGDGSTVDDVSLVLAYLDGDAAAFDTLFGRYNQRVRSVCLRYLGDKAAAEDLVQETFFNVIRSLHKVGEGFNFGAWVHRIAVNICQDELRRRNRRASHVADPSGDPEEQMLKLADSDRHRSPEDALEMSYLRQLVWQVAKKLPERQRMVLTLRELQGLSYSSIAHVMGISDAAVETLLHRARKRFKEEYLLLDTPPEHPGDCAITARLLMENGRDNLDAVQRRRVVDHLSACAWCQARFLPDEAEAAPAMSRGAR